MLTAIETTFRSSKNRPVYRHKEDRVAGYLFITLLAYHLVHTLRYQLKPQGIQLGWDSIRNIMLTQQRITIIPCQQMTVKQFSCAQRPKLKCGRNNSLLP
jgi:transposase